MQKKKNQNIMNVFSEKGIIFVWIGWFFKIKNVSFTFLNWGFVRMRKLYFVISVYCVVQHIYIIIQT